MHIYIYIYIYNINQEDNILILIYQPSNNFESVNRVIGRIKVFKMFKISQFQNYIIALHTNPKYFSIKI